MTALPSLIDVFIIIILIVPGFVALAIIRFLAYIERKDSDFVITIWSVFISLPILALFCCITGVSDIDGMRDIIFEPDNLALLILLTLSFGGLIGSYPRMYYKLIGKKLFSGTCWDIVFQKFSKKGSHLIVYTTDGSEYMGDLRYSNSDEQPLELVIKNPIKLIRNDDGTLVTTINIEGEMLFTEKDVRRVAFRY